MKGKDGLIVREIKRHSGDKLNILQRYVYAFLQALKKQRQPKFYLDLFAGPGRCFNTKTEKEIDGSPVIAIETGESIYGFEKYIFIDVDEKNIDSLKKRIDERFPNVAGKIEFILGDCNAIYDEIHNLLPQYSFTLAFIDPEGLDISFNTIEKITEGKRVDLIINFPIGMAAKRNMKQFLKQEESKLDRFLGTNLWRKNIESTKDPMSITCILAETYKEKLKTIEYKDVEPIDDMQLIKSTKKSLPLYYLIFASKSSRGHCIWRSIIRKKPNGQRSLF